MKRFESVIENVSEINIKCYGDLEMRERVIEVWAKSDDDKEYVYKFRGACAGVNRLYELIKENEKLKEELHSLKNLKKSNLPETPITDTMLVDGYLKLTKENEELKAKSKDISEDNALLLETNKQLKKENEEFGNQILEYIEKNNILQEENEKLEEVSKEWEKEAVKCSFLRDKAKKELSLEKAANEAQRKFIKEYAGKDTEVQFNYAIDEVKEVSYAIVEKERYQSLNDRSCMAIVHGKRYNTVQIVDMIHELEESNKKLKYKIAELEELQTPTIENFAYEEPSSKPTPDNVNHPSHYETGKFECIEVMQEVFGITAVCDFCKCNAFKYIYRMDRKNGDEDVRKAIWYLNKYLELSEKIDIYKEIGGLIPRPEFVKDCFTDEKDGGTDDGRKKQVPEGE